ncbi:MAG: carbamoyltransferase HypF [Nitrospinae bacterium]|nr:carbamoyltransferase HypF [Nitrospinota bacterium]
MPGKGERARKIIEVTGIVQGVGFRPFIHHLAGKHGVAGNVLNNVRGVVINAEGAHNAVNAFEEDIVELAPPLAHITSIKSTFAEPTGARGFVIVESEYVGDKRALIAPDADVCPDCLREMLDPADRRHRYPFINCVNCGPRFTIVTDVPYDRPNTTMSAFPMCHYCRSEYENPENRRYHAQPVACPVCGPRLMFLGPDFMPLAADDPIVAAMETLAQGKIVAIKGIGGYHLACDAGNDEAVNRLRTLKKRDEKPFAIMFTDLATVARYAHLSEKELALLASRPHPITLVKKIAAPSFNSSTPGNRYIGAMLPYSPLHHLLFHTAPYNSLVMTSANISDEPIVYRDDDAKTQLAGIADNYLAHNRPIHNKADDSIEKVMGHGPVVIRRSRGYTPAPIMLDREYPNILAVGGELKNTFCLIKGDRAFLSQHMGDLKYEDTLATFTEGVERMLELLGINELAAVAHDMHPAYLSSTYALSRPEAVKVAAQHHHAHMASLMAERGLDGEVIGIIFDGTGYGLDGSIWGGEFLTGSARQFKRAGAINPIPLLGGDAAIREPYRLALALLFELYGDSFPTLPVEWLNSLEPQRLQIFRTMLKNRVNTPLSHGMGRMFDTVSALIGLCPRASFEGQAAMALEMEVETGGYEAYPFFIAADGGQAVSLDFRDTFKSLVEDVIARRGMGIMAARFHETVAQAALAMAGRIRKESGLNRVLLSGGVFQNSVLSDRLGALLQSAGFDVYRHGRAPCNDGGLALGQALIAAKTLVND